ncbi:MAG TPA: DUF2272 domain-containing protein, partial [Roseococcus sp.]|nr:DUF2272 domain-containing protein [Roseococcus sp.]
AVPAPPAPLAPPLSYPPLARERMLRMALAEWQEWGCAVSGEIGPPLVIGCEGGSAPQREGDPAGFPRILAYWRAVPDAPGVVPTNRARFQATLRGEAAGLWAEPAWSAAFISWVVGAAGIDVVEFAPSASHAFYLDHLDRLAAAYPERTPFLPRDPAAYAPRPGDLACRDRSTRDALTQWADRAGERGRFRPMHCDIVVSAGPGIVEAVGGNVADAVTLARWPADGEGRVLAPLLVVMENRLGRLPPWGSLTLSSR